MREALFLTLVFAGVLALLAGMLLTRVHWRQDIPPYGRQTRFIDVTLHPERYAKDAPFRMIRTLSTAGAASNPADSRFLNKRIAAFLNSR